MTESEIKNEIGRAIDVWNKRNPMIALRDEFKLSVIRKGLSVAVVSSGELLFYNDGLHSAYDWIWKLHRTNKHSNFKY